MHVSLDWPRRQSSSQPPLDLCNISRPCLCWLIGLETNQQVGIKWVLQPDSTVFVSFNSSAQWFGVPVQLPRISWFFNGTMMTQVLYSQCNPMKKCTLYFCRSIQLDRDTLFPPWENSRHWHSPAPIFTEFTKPKKGFAAKLKLFINLLFIYVNEYLPPFLVSRQFTTIVQISPTKTKGKVVSPNPSALKDSLHKAEDSIGIQKFDDESSEKISFCANFPCIVFSVRNC